MIFVLAGTHKQFENFCHVFGKDFRELVHSDQLRTHPNADRPLVLLIGTWYENRLRDEVLEFCKSTDQDSRPRGQAFAKMGSPTR